MTERDGSPRATAGAGTTAEIEALLAWGGDGTLRVGGGVLRVTHLDKVFFPGPPAITKGDLMRFYAEMSPWVLPPMRNRPLVLKRFPDGVTGKGFFQHDAPDELPRGVRAETVTDADGDRVRRLVGGSLATLLYTVQLGAIAYDPWHSRLIRGQATMRYADYAVLDLDPGPGVPISRTVEVALRVQDEMERSGLHAALKTSGSRGLHIYLPLPARTPLAAALKLAEQIATRVAEAHPRIATVERSLNRRPGGTVYVDYLQNTLGKTVAGVYAVRAKPGATVSAPLRWDELTSDLQLAAFTVHTMPERMRAVGDLWAEAMKTANRLPKPLRTATDRGA